MAVYAIAKNESRQVRRFMNGVRDADETIVVDTGSTDDTVALLRAAGAQVHVADMGPFRFDDARNTCLGLVPSGVDVCFALDLDEVPEAGWRDALERAWQPNTTRLWHRYTWNRNPDGSPGVYYYANRLHSRHGYRWVGPAHEALVPVRGFDESLVTCDELQVEHLPDRTKSRAMYLPLLELGAREAPEDSRMRYYLCREYIFYQMWDDVIREVEQFLKLPFEHWRRQRSATMRMMARAYRCKGEPSECILIRTTTDPFTASIPKQD